MMVIQMRMAALREARAERVKTQTQYQRDTPQGKGVLLKKRSSQLMEKLWNRRLLRV
jgi:hypothetical protein